MCLRAEMCMASAPGSFTAFGKVFYSYFYEYLHILSYSGQIRHVSVHVKSDQEQRRVCM